MPAATPEQMRELEEAVERNVAAMNLIEDAVEAALKTGVFESQVREVVEEAIQSFNEEQGE